MGNTITGGDQQHAGATGVLDSIKDAAAETIRREGEQYARHRMKEITSNLIDGSSWHVLAVTIPLVFASIVFGVAMAYLLGQLCWANIKSLAKQTLYALAISLVVFLVGWGAILGYLWFYKHI